MIEDLETWATENGYSMVYQIDDIIVSLLENPFNTQIVVGDEWGVKERYSYSTVAEAFVAFIHWTQKECEGEPTGWIRHQPSNRRRKDGDPNTEWVEA